jgi:hypothetical protein
LWLEDEREEGSGFRPNLLRHRKGKRGRWGDRGIGRLGDTKADEEIRRRGVEEIKSSKKGSSLKQTDEVSLTKTLAHDK